MPDLRISQLPPNASPIGLNDVFPIVPQGSVVTYKDTMNDLANFLVPLVTGAIGLPPVAGQSGEWLTNDGTNIFWSPLPSPPIPTIQQVLNAGNISNNQQIFFNGAPNGEDIVIIGNDGFVGNKSVLVARNTTLPIGVQHYFMNDRERYDNNNKTLTLSPHPLDNWYDLKYPKSNGTLVTKVNGIAANTNGNITLPILGSQSLDDVLSVGNIGYDKTLVIEKTFMGIPIAELVLDANTGKVRATDGLFGSKQTNIDFNGIEFISPSQTTKIKPSIVGGQPPNELILPSKDGILATSVNGVGADAVGNISLSLNDIGIPTIEQVLISGDNANLQGLFNLTKVTSISAEFYDIKMGSYIIYDTGLGIGITQPSLFIPGVELGDGVYISNYVDNGGRIKADNLTGGALFSPADRTYQLPNILPNTTQTFALSVNGTYADVNGNINLPSVSVPTLDQVLAAGNNGINKTIALTDTIGNSAASLISGEMMVRTANFFTYVKPNRIEFVDNISGKMISLLANYGATSHNLQLPNTNGILVTSINGVAPDFSGNVTIPIPSNPIDYVDFNLSPSATALTPAEGRISWNADLKTIQIDTENSGVNINVGHETIQRVRNVSGATITKGKIVYINGESGNRPTIALSSNTSDPTSAQTIGFVIENIANNNNGYIITNGLLENINTTGLASGTQLYLGTNGNFQTTFPTQPLHNVRVGIVINGNSVTGSIFVNILNGYEIEELHDVLITSPQNDEVLTYETSSGLWKNKIIPTQTPQLKTIEGQSLLGTGNIDLGKADVGLSNVDNTSDLNKPISTATQTALNNKQDTLVSATNIKTINGSSILGSGDLPVAANVKTLAGVSLSGSGNVTLDQILPTQSGNSGRVLKTNGTTASWQDDFTGPGGSSDGYCLHLGYAAWTPTLASNTWTTGWFYGQNPDTLFNDRPSRRFIIPKTGIIKSVTILTALGTAGSGVSQTLTISVHNITQGITSQIVTGYSIASGSLTSLSRQDIYSGLSIPVTAGDVCHIRILMPTFTTAPTGLSQIFNLFIEQ